MKRAQRYSPFEDLPPDFWMVAIIGVLMFALSIAIIFRAAL